jgi:HK97 gp10 family phage protein
MRNKARSTSLEIAEEIAAEITHRAPRATGHLAESVNVHTTKTESVVRIGADYWQYVEYGTGIYGPLNNRMPSSGQPLHFSWNGQEYFLANVAGQHPQPFVAPAIEYVRTRRRKDSKRIKR